MRMTEEAMRRMLRSGLRRTKRRELRVRLGREISDDFEVSGCGEGSPTAAPEAGLQ
ncbi:hypothetical protein [Cohnella boryungensis]|uniref:Uncharacterized protein n=1 Tax=Cohnella boryungensis TaxID=768479 RepID=A0ABV8S6D4_9BACL